MAKAEIRLITSNKGNQPPKGAAAHAPTTFDRERAARLAEAFRDLEGTFWDFENMARVVESTVHDMLEDDPAKITGNREFYYIGNRQVEVALFVVRHLRQMIEDAKEEYYRDLESGA